MSALIAVSVIALASVRGPGGLRAGAGAGAQTTSSLSGTSSSNAQLATVGTVALGGTSIVLVDAVVQLPSGFGRVAHSCAPAPRGIVDNVPFSGNLFAAATSTSGACLEFLVASGTSKPPMTSGSVKVGNYQGVVCMNGSTSASLFIKISPTFDLVLTSSGVPETYLESVANTITPKVALQLRSLSPGQTATPGPSVSRPSAAKHDQRSKTRVGRGYSQRGASADKHRVARTHHSGDAKVDRRHSRATSDDRRARVSSVTPGVGGGVRRDRDGRAGARHGYGRPRRHHTRPHAQGPLQRKKLHRAHVPGSQVGARHPASPGQPDTLV